MANRVVGWALILVTDRYCVQVGPLTTAVLNLRGVGRTAIAVVATASAFLGAAVADLESA